MAMPGREVANQLPDDWCKARGFEHRVDTLAVALGLEKATNTCVSFPIPKLMCDKIMDIIP